MSSRLVMVAAAVLAFSIAACGAGSEDVAAQSSEVNVRCAGSCDGGHLTGDGLLTPVDRENGLRSDWAPAAEELPPNYFSGTNKSLRADARDAMMRMLKDAYDRDGVNMYCHSGYRSFATQCAVFNEEHAPTRGCDGANLVSAHAGHSEHQLGTACDLSYEPYVGSSDPFVRAGDAADQWLRAHAHEYGFANSYPNDRVEDNDGYVHEPWHYRYIGVAAAAELRRRGRIAVPRFIRSLSPEERAALEGGQAPAGGQPGEGECGSLTLLGYCEKNTIVFCKDGVIKSKDCTGNGNVCSFVSAAHGHDCIPPSPCEGVDFRGVCDGEVLSFCENGALRKLDCTARGNHCRLESEASGFNCLP